jgi:hypothetical protein
VFSFLQAFQQKSYKHFSFPHSLYMHRPSHSPCQIVKHLTIRFRPASHHFILLLPNILPNNFFSQTLGLCSSLNAKDQVLIRPERRVKYSYGPLNIYWLVFGFVQTAVTTNCGRCKLRSLQTAVSANCGHYKLRSLQTAVTTNGGRCKLRSLQTAVTANCGRSISPAVKLRELNQSTQGR